MNQYFAVIAFALIGATTIVETTKDPRTFGYGCPNSQNGHLKLCRR
jgi:hypothetical protein